MIKKLVYEIYYWAWFCMRKFRERTVRLYRKSITRYTVNRLKKIKGCNICIGNNFLLDKDVEINLDSGSSLTVGDGVQIRSGCRIRVTNNGQLTIGDNVYLACNGSISCWHKIKIDDDAIFASYASLHDHQHKFDLKKPVSHSVCEQFEPVTIGKGVWLAKGVCVMNGVSVGDYSVIGANSVVTKDVPKGCVAGGVPARILRGKESECE